MIRTLAISYMLFTYIVYTNLYNIHIEIYEKRTNRLLSLLFNPLAHSITRSLTRSFSLIQQYVHCTCMDISALVEVECMQKFIPKIRNMSVISNTASPLNIRCPTTERNTEGRQKDIQVAAVGSIFFSCSFLLFFLVHSRM